MSSEASAQSRYSGGLLLYSFLQQVVGFGLCSPNVPLQGGSSLGSLLGRTGSWGRALLSAVDRLERSPRVNLVKLNEAKCKVLHLCQDNPKHKYRLGEEWIWSSPEEKDLVVLADEKLNIQQCALAA